MFTRKRPTQETSFEVTRTDQEWKDVLPADRYRRPASRRHRAPLVG